MSNPQKYDPNKKALGADKLSRIPVKIEDDQPRLKKPPWIRIKLPTDNKVASLKNLLRENRLVTVCEEASCPNLNECFGHGTATFMIMGEKCTRRCAFCDVGHGRPDPLDQDEPSNLAKTVATMKLKYVVITSVDRDDLRDGGAAHYVACIDQTRALNPDIKIEVLVPDFRGRMDKALDIFADGLPDVFNHNIETAPRLYKQMRAGSDFQWSLTLLQKFKQRYSGIPTKSGIMVGLGETDDEVIAVLDALRKHDVEMLTIGQYLQPTKYHAPVKRYVTPEQFQKFAKYAKNIGFDHVASGPLVRSSYHADLQASGIEVS
ncbi:MAG: lipoyl synthase [Gammaproteobacteria bacterium]|nr:lipoyl synthase [Gammaproteobacteria bacterium]MCH9744621.1 lipoyl synthase [Gammaproteobacteria bacterium]